MERKGSFLKEQDIVLGILQFLKENNYEQSFKTLQHESKVQFNFFTNISQFTSHIESGKWDLVVDAMKKNVVLHEITRFKIYKQMFYELIELGEESLANHLFDDVLRKIRSVDEEKIRKLSKTHNRDIVKLFQKRSKLERRRKIVKVVISELDEFPPNRILQLISNGLKYEKQQQQIYFEKSDRKQRSIIPQEEEEEEEADLGFFFPRRKKEVKLENSFSQCISISPNGKYLISGSSDGFLEIFHPLDGSMNKELPHQSQNRFMKHNSGILSLSVSKNSRYLASGDTDGTLKIWEIEIGRCLAKFEKIHKKGVTCLTMASDNSRVASSGLDFQIHVIGLKTGKILHSISDSHKATIKTLSFTNDDQFLISSGADGYVNVYRGKTYSKHSSFKPKTFDEFSPCVIFDTLITTSSSQDNSEHDDEILIVNSSSNSIGVYDFKGTVKIEFENPFFSRTGSFQKLVKKGDLVYAITETGVLFVYSCSMKKLMRSAKLVDKKILVLDMKIHPTSDAIFTTDEFSIKIHTN